ncbi:MAG: DNA-directed RNA polymerase subunit beta, partial [Lentisphaerae bacterium]|nr:DNA-directed RNA polymerase subunit beta [Lentisphaerota bacterium]
MVQRTSFGKLKPVIEPPDMIDVQVKSYESFLQLGKDAGHRKKQGLQGILKEVFPIESYDGRYVLEFLRYELSTPRMSALDCLGEGQTYASPLHIIFRLKDGEEFREESVYMGEIPLMTEHGSFIVNGAERVVVSQLHRSPGICSEQTVHPNGAILYSMRIIPDRGSWIEIQFDTSDQMWIFMDRRRRRRKFLATTFLRAIGYGTDEELLSLFYKFGELSLGKIPTGEAIANRVFKEDVVDVDSRTILARKYDVVTETVLRQMKDAGFRTAGVVDVSWDEGILLGTVKADPTHSADEALKDIYHRLRPGDPATPSNARQLLRRQFFDPKRYDLGLVGRYKINQKLTLKGKVADSLRVLDRFDVIESIRHLIALRRGEESVDDIDHLGSRRVRTVGELLENQCRVGLARTERLIRERMTLFDPSTGILTPQRLVNSKSLSAVV